MNIKINVKINFFKPRKEKLKNYEPSAPPYYEQITTIKWQRLGVLVVDIIVILIIKLNTKRNPKTRKLVKIIKGRCSICNRNKSQVLLSK